jgi:hypothetical protein
MRRRFVLLILTTGLTALFAMAEKIDPANGDFQHAFAEYAGWVRAEPSGDGGSGVQVDDFAWTGWMWGENVGWGTFAPAGPNPYKVSTRWCQTTLAVPAGIPELTVETTGDLSWPALADAAWYEAVRGELTALRSSNRDFTVATVERLEDNLTMASLSPSDSPSAGEGFWYVVRCVNCKGKGSTHSGGMWQVGLRDTEIAASTSACP